MATTTTQNNGSHATKILRACKGKEGASMASILENFPAEQHPTVRADLAQLRADGRIKKVGETRATRYFAV